MSCKESLIAILIENMNSYWWKEYTQEQQECIQMLSEITDHTFALKKRIEEVEIKKNINVGNDNMDEFIQFECQVNVLTGDVLTIFDNTQKVRKILERLQSDENHPSPLIFFKNLDRIIDESWSKVRNNSQHPHMILNWIINPSNSGSSKKYEPIFRFIDHERNRFEYLGKMYDLDEIYRAYSILKYNIEQLVLDGK